jgi:hypothetical protein
MRRIGTAIIGLGAAVGIAVGVAILMHAGLPGVPWLVNVALAKLGLVASGGLMTGGAVSLRLAKRREEAILPRNRS